MSKMIKFKCGCEIDPSTFSFSNIPLDCPETWKLIATGYTKGIFQIEKNLGKRYSEEIRPESVEELSDLVSLIRPGCLEAEFREKPEDPGKFSSITNTYIKVKDGKWAPEYIDPVLEPIFEATRSVPIYQEQIMRICTDFAGFNLQEADVARKAVGKKKKDVMEKVKKKFIAGAIERGHEQGLAETIFGWIEKFSGYGFNKCVTGNTVLNRGAANQHSSGLYTVEHLYKLVNDYQYAKNCKQIPLRKKLRREGCGKCMAVCTDGRVRPMPIKDIHFNGKKKVVRVTDNGGREISCTLDHKFMCPDGQMRSISEIGVGGQVLCHIDCYDDEYIYDYCVHKEKERGNTNNLTDITGRKNWGFIDGNWAAFEKIKNDNWNINYCQICLLKASRLEWHHIDGDRSNNTEDNLIKLCVSCHKKEDYKLGRNGRFDKGHKTGVATIVSIKDIGERDTYDVEMDTPEHNWVANGFVVSNSHGVSYATIGYRTAYAKRHFPLKFFKAMLANSDGKQDSQEEIHELVFEARKFGVDVNPPNLKLMNLDFEINDKDNSISFGLGHIKGVGEGAFESLKRIKDCKNPEDFLVKSFKKGSKVRKDVAEALIKSGSLDYMSTNRIGLLCAYKMMSELTEREQKFIGERLADGDTFNAAFEALLESKVPNKARKPKIRAAADEILRALGGNKKKMEIAYERHYLGIPLSGSLVELYSNEYVNIKCTNFQRLRAGSQGSMGVVIEKIKRIKDKRGNWMCFLTVSDETYMLDCIVVFASYYNKIGWILEEGKPLLISGKKDKRGSFLVNHIEHL